MPFQVGMVLAAQKNLARRIDFEVARTDSFDERFETKWGPEGAAVDH